MIAKRSPPIPLPVGSIKPIAALALIAASTALFGDSALAVCLPAVVLETWRSWFVFLLARAHLDYGRCVSGWQRIPNACESRGANRRLAIALGTGLAATTVTCLLGYAMILKGSKLDPGLRMRG